MPSSFHPGHDDDVACRILLGSLLNSQPAGGKFDGVAGVMAAPAVAVSVAERRAMPPAQFRRIRQDPANAETALISWAALKLGLSKRALIEEEITAYRESLEECTRERGPWSAPLLRTICFC